LSGDRVIEWGNVEMHDMKKNRLRGSTLLKTVCIVLLCICGAICVYGAFSWCYVESLDGSTYLNSDSCKSSMMNDADQILSAYLYDDSQTDSSYTLSNSNIRYNLQVESGEDYKTVESNDTDAALYDTSYTFFYDVYMNDSNDLLFDHYYDSEPATIDDSDTVYRVQIALPYSLQAVDAYYYNQQRYTAIVSNWNLIMIGVPAAAILFVGILIYLFCAVGHRCEDDEIHEIWIDKIPLEIVLLFSACISSLCGSYMDTVTSYAGLNGAGWDYAVMALILLLMTAGLSILVSLLTMAKRIKMHSFWKSTLLRGILAGIKDLFSRISIVPRAAVLIVGAIIAQMLLCMKGHYFLALILDAAAAVYLIVCAEQSQRIENAGHALASGNLDYQIPDIDHMYGIYKKHAEDLSSIREGMKYAVSEQMKSEHLKTELITNVSHDIKTPLTSVINYVELLKKDHTEEQGKQYLDVLDRQSQRLKKLTEDVIEASKASSGNINAQLTKINTHEILEQSLAEYQERFDAGKLTPVLSVEDDPLYILADGRLLWRVMSNLFSNICKYAQTDTRVYMHAQSISETMAEITITNISHEQLNISADELMQRFVRGDVSRHTEGSGLGLSIAESLIKLMNGTFQISIDGDMFKVRIQLPKYSEPDVSADSEVALNEE
jgi:signal transduction histidine kinase